MCRMPQHYFLGHESSQLSDSVSSIMTHSGSARTPFNTLLKDSATFVVIIVYLTVHINILAHVCCTFNKINYAHTLHHLCHELTPNDRLAFLLSIG
jgi:hypothetical protein